MRADFGSAPTNYTSLIIALLLAFVCGHAIAWVYMFTHTGLSYSRSYVNTLIIMPVIVALVMLILANNLVLAFGLMAIFAMVRFRSILRDTLDTTYVLAVIVIGLAFFLRAKVTSTGVPGGVQLFFTASCNHSNAFTVPSSAQLTVIFPWLSTCIGLPPKVQIQGQKPTSAYSVLEISMPMG